MHGILHEQDGLSLAEQKIHQRTALFGKSEHALFPRKIIVKRINFFQNVHTTFYEFRLVCATRAASFAKRRQSAHREKPRRFAALFMIARARRYGQRAVKLFR